MIVCWLFGAVITLGLNNGSKTDVEGSAYETVVVRPLMSVEEVGRPDE
jgi:hypothetical protein